MGEPGRQPQMQSLVGRDLESAPRLGDHHGRPLLSSQLPFGPCHTSIQHCPLLPVALRRRAAIDRARTGSDHQSKATRIRAAASGMPPINPVQNTKSCIVVASVGGERRRPDRVWPQDPRCLLPQKYPRKMAANP